MSLYRNSFCYRDDHSYSTIPKDPESATSRCSTSNDMVVIPRSQNLVADEDRTCRGVKKQKYPLDDYLINTNTEKRLQESLLSPISPVSSPETINVLENAERLVKSAHKQIIEVNFNSALHTLDENPLSYIRHQPLDDSLLYVHEMVNSKFQESNDPTNSRKVSTNNAASLDRTLRHDQFPVKESNGMLNKPLEISQQNSEFSTGHMAKGIFPQNEKSFFKKAPNWFGMKPPEHINVFPTFMTSNSRCKTENSCTVPHCTMANTGVIEINGRDNLNGTIQVQTGPSVDIQRGLTVQTIENVHISPNPSSVPIYNNIATYCFQHEPSTSTSFADSNRTRLDKHSITSSTARNAFDTRKERHIQSTEYNNIQKIEHIEDMSNVGTSLIKNSISPSHDMNEDIIGEQAMLTNDSKDADNHSNNKNVNCNEIDLSNFRNIMSTDSNVIESKNLSKSSISNENLHEPGILQGLVRNAAESGNLKKAVSIKIAPVKSPVYEEFPIEDAKVESECEEQDFKKNSLSKDYYEISSNMEPTRRYDDQKFYHVQTNKNYVQRSQVCGNECKTGSCSRKCERDVEYREKQNLKKALETIANIEKIRFDLKDTGIASGECTQNHNGKNHCNADAMSFDFEPFSEPERFRTALENLCKFSQNTKASKIDTNSTIYQERIDAVVKLFFDSNNQSNHVRELRSPDLNLAENQSVADADTVEKAQGEKKRSEVGKTLKQVKLFPEPKKMVYRQGSSKIVKPKINNVAVNNLSTIKNNTSDSPISQKKPNKYSKPQAPQTSLSPRDKIAQEERFSSEMISNEVGNTLKNLDLKRPCVSDVDAVLKTYRESMAAICRGTEQLSQLISHHIMQNALSTSDQIPSPPIPSCSIILGNTDGPRDTGNEKTSAELVLNLGSYSPSKMEGQLDPIYQKNCTDRNVIHTSCRTQIQSTKLKQQKHEPDRFPHISRDDVEFSNENNSVCTNETPVSTGNECSSTCSRSNSTLTSKVYEQSPVNSKTHSPPTKCTNLKNVHKSDGNQYNVQYCTAEPFEATLPIKVTPDKKNSPSQSGLSTYIHLENACGKVIRLKRHSNYDIHGDQSGDFNLYKCPVLISAQRDNADTSNNDSNHKFAAIESVTQTKELQVFGQILDAVKNSSQFMNRVVVSLFSGLEVDSINDILRKLEDAAVHPIVIEQLLVMLKERNKDKSLFRGNIRLTNQVPAFDDCQKNDNEATDLPKPNDNMNSFKHCTGFNGSMVTTNMYANEAKQDPAVLGLATLGPIQLREMNIEFNEDRVHSIYNCDNPKNEALKDTLSSDQVQCEMILEKHITEEEGKNIDNNLAISKTSFEKKSHLSEPSLTLSCSIFQIPVLDDAVEKKSQQDRQEAKKNSLETEHPQNKNAVSKGQSNASECQTNSIFNEETSENNDSESNTDKDISFVIPNDADMNNEVMDLSTTQKLTAMTSKNVTTGRLIESHIESNSLTQERSTKINFNSDPGQSSLATAKGNEKLQNSNHPTLNPINLTENSQKDDRSIRCHCQRAKDHGDPNIKSHPVPCDSSLDAVNTLIDLQIQSNYQQLGLINSEEIAFRCLSDKSTRTSDRTVNKRPRPSILSATSKSPTRRADDSTRPGSRQKKSFDKKVSENKKVLHDNKRRSARGVKNNERSDSEKSDLKNACPLCIQLQGKCTCMDCMKCKKKFKRNNQASPELRKGKEQPIRNVKSPRQSGSPKRSGYTGGKYLSRKDLNSTSKEVLSVPLQSGNNVKRIGTRTVKDAAFIAHESKLKPSSGMLSSDSNNNDELTKRKLKPRKDKKSLQNSASDSDNLKVEDKSKNIRKSEGVIACKSIVTQNTAIPGHITVCESSTTLCNKVSILPSLLLPRKLEKITEVDTVDKTLVKQAGRLQCFESCSLMKDSSADYRDTHSIGTNISEEKITRCTELKDLLTMGSQTSEMRNNVQEHETNLPEQNSQQGTVSVSKTTCPNIFDHESIIVLQPLNELDHTFFIAKPNCAEKQIIQEKLNKRFNVQVREIIEHTYSSVYELDQRHKETENELTHSNRKVVEHANCIDRGTSKDVSVQLNSATSLISCAKNEECQASCPDGTGMEIPITLKQSSVTFAPIKVTDSNVSVLENQEDCTDLCRNDDECLRICSQPSPELDDLMFHCKQDCPNEEICIKLCPPKPQAEPSSQSSLININEKLKKFIAENNVSNVKWPTVKGLLKELKNVEEFLRPENEKLGTMYEKAESQNNHDKAEMKNIGCNADRSQRKSVQYEEPHEKMKHIMRNRKSLILPNVVRGIADMHPSRKLEHFRLLSADPVVSGNFNKPESDRKYSVFNRPDPGHSSIDLKDPRMQAYLDSIGQQAKVYEGVRSSSDTSIDVVPSAVTQIPKETPTSGKSNNNSKSKLNKSRRGMDADFNILLGLNKRLAGHDNNSMKSFESSDLEPGEFLEVRTPFDKPTKSRQLNKRINSKIPQVLQDQAKCHGLCNDDKNHLRSVMNVDRINTHKTTKKQHETLENKYELRMDAESAVYIRKKHKSNSEKLISHSERVSLDTKKPIGNGTRQIVGKSNPESGVENHQLVCCNAKDLKYSTDYLQLKNQSIQKLNIEWISKAQNSISISDASFTDIKSNSLEAMEEHTASINFKSSQLNNSHISKVVEHSHGIVDENQNIDRLHKYSEQLVNDTEYSNRPQIIDHFLGKRKLEDMKMEYTNNKTDTMFKESQSLGGTCQRVYFKSDFTSKTTPDSENSDIVESPDLSVIRDDVTQFNFSLRTCNEKDLANSNQTTSKCWDQMSSDTYSEGEINLPSSCSYSLGEVKISSRSSSTVEKSFKDPDGLTIFLTKSILDCAHATCTSPGEILAEIHKTETDFSSSIS